MKMFAFVALLATAGLAQAQSSWLPMPIECPEGYYPTAMGSCQPDFDFD
ncbi:hypothetical protein [Pseudomonas sp. NMI760_13]|jgi:hypothetical protein|nr:hypothetical protein [Pseudomonas sp. NMI760_13]MCE0914107.1 hypothetical protein [Pseudomonas sp. NMI760_13]